MRSKRFSLWKFTEASKSYRLLSSFHSPVVSSRRFRSFNSHDNIHPLLPHKTILRSRLSVPFCRLRTRGLKIHSLFGSDMAVAASLRDQALSLLAAANKHVDLAFKISSLKQAKYILLSMDTSLASELVPYFVQLQFSPESHVRKLLVE